MATMIPNNNACLTATHVSVTLMPNYGDSGEQVVDHMNIDRIRLELETEIPIVGWDVDGPRMVVPGGVVSIGLDFRYDESTPPDFTDFTIAHISGFLIVDVSNGRVFSRIGPGGIDSVFDRAIWPSMDAAIRHHSSLASSTLGDLEEIRIKLQIQAERLKQIEAEMYPTAAECRAAAAADCTD